MSESPELAMKPDDQGERTRFPIPLERELGIGQQTPSCSGRFSMGDGPTLLDTTFVSISRVSQLYCRHTDLRHRVMLVRRSHALKNGE